MVIENQTIAVKKYIAFITFTILAYGMFGMGLCVLAIPLCYHIDSYFIYMCFACPLLFAFGGGALAVAWGYQQEVKFAIERGLLDED